MSLEDRERIFGEQYKQLAYHFLVEATSLRFLEHTAAQTCF